MSRPQKTRQLAQPWGQWVPEAAGTPASEIDTTPRAEEEAVPHSSAGDGGSGKSLGAGVTQSLVERLGAECAGRHRAV
ncbi:hypothetical protein I79_004778 [Cricetulus griseus]|uniref:Uncharacterized protein n=1 Tax=Cricetulus griseus TaxID=10029 RepID=G3H3G2_CRIGR|nr:hypothetical protein I79_004778 [Cricetulus griseus]